MRFFRKPDPLPLSIRTPAFTEHCVVGKRTEPSKPFDMRNGTAERWKFTDLKATFDVARNQLKTGDN